MKKSKILSLITLLTLTLLSCGGGGGGGSTVDNTPVEDTTAPKANNVKPANKATIDLDGNSSGVINFKADLVDNVALASYSIEIHQNTEGHKDPTTKGISKVPFNYPEKSWTVQGKTATVEQTIPIAPINNQAIQEGSYHFVLTVKDKAGNKTVVINEIILRYI